MKIGWATDIHMDFPLMNAYNKFIQQINDADIAALLITGDISDGKSAKYLVELKQQVRVPIWFVLGNHDYYTGKKAQVTRELLRESIAGVPGLCYLPDINSIKLNSEGEYLVGIDGWWDGFYGKMSVSKFAFNHFRLISDLDLIGSSVIKAKCREFADISNEMLSTKIDYLFQCIPAPKTIVIATHYPPFCESSLYNGRWNEEFAASWFINGSLGQLLLKLAAAKPEVQFKVLCGHSHEHAFNSVTHNLVVITGEAEYAKPALNAILEY